MGNQHSAIENRRRNNDPEIQRRGAPRISSRRVSKTEQKALDIETTIRALRRSIEAYDGLRGTAGYKALHYQLSKNGQEVQELLMKSAKPARQAKFKTLQKEISNLFQLLEEKVERNERQLDSAAVESHSFIAPQPAKYIATVAKYDTNLDEVAHRTTILQDEIHKAVTIDDTSQYKLLEQKLNMLYSDLEKIDNSGIKSSNRKDSINRSLMRQAKKLQNIKPEKKKVPDEKNKEERQTIAKIEDELSDVEVKVMTFEYLKADPKYMELDQILKGYWATLSGLEDATEENRRRKLKTIDLIKKILQELSKRAEENYKKVSSALDKINDIEDDVLALTNSTEKFWGLKNDAEYSSIDQKLRNLWAKLNDIHNSHETIVIRKEEAIQTVQNLLKTLHQNAEKNAKNGGNRENLKATTYILNVDEDLTTRRNIAQNCLLEDLEEYENKWIALENLIKNNKKKDEVEQIRNIVQNLEKKMSTTLQYLSRLSINTSQNPQHQFVEKVRVMQKETETVRKIDSPKRSSKNFEQDGRNLSPPERLITELAVSRTLSSLNTIDSDLDALKNKILRSEQSDKTSRSELEMMQTNILDLETCLNPTVVDQRNKVFQKLSEVNILLDSIRSKKETSEETNRLKAVVEGVQKLKKKVDCFTGTYNSVPYVQIENGLKDCLEELEDITSENDKIRKTKEQLKNKIDRYLQILDERSLKVGSQENLVEKPKPSFTEKASSIVNLLNIIRSSLEKFKGGPETLKLDDDINKCKEMIQALTPINDDQKLIQDQYMDYISKLITYFQSRANEEQVIPTATPGKMLMQLEHELTELKNQITRLNTIENDSEFEKTQLELDDLLVRVNSVETLTSDDKEFRNNLQGSIQSLNLLLKTKRRSSKRMSQYNEQLNKVKLEEVQEAIANLANEVYSFSEDNYRQRYDELDETMTNIFLKIQSLDTDSTMRDYLIKQIQSHKKLLQEKLKEVACTEKSGTEV